MKLSEIYRQALAAGGFESPSPMVIFSGTMKNGPGCKNFLPGKVFGIVSQEMIEDNWIDQGEGEIEIDNPVFTTYDDLDKFDGLDEIRGYLERSFRENDKRVASDMLSVLDVVYRFYRAHESRSMDFNIGLWVTKNGSPVLPAEYEEQDAGIGEEGFFDDVYVCAL